MSNELATTGANQLPAYLQQYAGPMGTDELKQFMYPSFLRIVQAMSKAKATFPEGSIYIAPDAIQLAGPPTGGESTVVPFVPLVFYREFCVWNPLKAQKLGEGLPAIRERSLDPNSETARICGDQKLRNSYPCPELPEQKLMYCEHLNYIVRLHFKDAPMQPLILSFMRTAFKQGRRFSNLIMGRGAPLFACVFELRAKSTTNDQGTWFIPDVINPTTTEPFVSEQEFPLLEKLHKELSAKVQAGEVQADYEAGFDAGADADDMATSHVSDDELAGDTGL